MPDRPRLTSTKARREALQGRVLAALAGLVCFFFVVTLRDVTLARAVSNMPAARLPSSVGDRDAELGVSVADESGKPVAGASVRVFAMRDGKAYFAGDRNTDAAGHAVFPKLPRGEVWVLGYGAGKSRASTQLVLVAGAREASLSLRKALALDVVVVDESEHPVAGASIEVTTTDPLPYAAVTAADGVARVDRLGPAPYRVRAWAKGYDEVSRTGVVPGATPLRIRLERPATLAVTVVEPDGRPAVGATILAAGTGLWPARSTVTDAAGTARLGGLRGGVFDLQAHLGDEISRTELAVAVKRGEVKEVKLTLEPGERVRVIVTDGEGEGAPAIKDANVVLVEEGLSSFPLHGRTGADGAVELGPIARGRASVSARAAGFVARTAAVAEAAVEVKVPLLRGGSLAGDVVDDRGYPVAGAMIEIIGTDAEGMPIDETSAMIDFRDERFELALPGPQPLIPMGELGVTAGPIPDFPHAGAATPEPALSTRGATAHRGGDPWVTRADGTFRAEPVPPGHVHAIVRHPGYDETFSDAVTIRSGQESTVHVVLRQGGWIEGRVLEEDRTPVRGARVELAATHGALEKVVYAADDGTFTFAAVPDEVMLSVSRPDAPGDVQARMTVDVPDRDRRSVEIVLPRPRETVSIRVTDDRGYPVDRVEVRAVSLDLADPLRRTLFTSEAGEAELRDAVGLPLRLILVRPGKAPLVQVVERAPRKLALTMGEGIEGRGNVTARGGRDRVAGVEVTLFTASGARHARTDAEGAYKVTDLAPGRVRVSLSHAEHAPAERVVAVVGGRDHPADLGTIDLAEAGEVEGEVLDADERPVAGARVAEDAVPTYLPAGPMPRGIVLTDRKGRFKLGGLPEGKVALEAYFADLGRGRVDDVAVRAGRTTDRVKIILPGDRGARDPQGAGSLAVTLGERAVGGARVVVVLMVPFGSEAEAAGVEPGDELTAVNGQEVRSIEAARKRLTGPLAEDVILELRRPEEADKRTIVRVRRERVRR